MNASNRPNPAPRVLVLQHADPEHPGLIADAVHKISGTLETIRGDLGQSAPATLDGYSGLIIMGGPQSVYEEEKFPYLRAEKQLARQAINDNIPLIGVCLGSQIIADVLGSEVHPSGGVEIGWKDITRSPDIAANPVLSALPETFTPLHWHGDVYDLPTGATPIGASEMTPVQGFTYGETTFAPLFHLEMTEQQIADMATLFPDDVRRGGLDPETLLAGTPARAAAIKPIATEIFTCWAGLITQ